MLLLKLTLWPAAASRSVASYIARLTDRLTAATAYNPTVNRERERERELEGERDRKKRRRRQIGASGKWEIIAAGKGHRIDKGLLSLSPSLFRSDPSYTEKEAMERVDL